MEILRGQTVLLLGIRLLEVFLMVPAGGHTLVNWAIINS